MRILDKRLVRRAAPVRRLLYLDVAVGIGSAALVLVQAVLIGSIVAQAFAGAGLAEVSADLALLALTFFARSVTAWTFEVAGRRAASRVLSELRLALVERRLRDEPLALDGAEAGEVAATAVQGVEGLEAYFARYLPQVLLAVIVPVAVLALVTAIDPLSAGLMLLTLPLVPVFMWLIGRYTEERTRERWLALRLLSNHFLDVVRGLPTLRAFNRSRQQASTLAQVGEHYRRTTIGTLRVGFLSGSVLELAATLGVALIAVTIGVRLVDGGLGLQAGLTVLVLAPELYLPVRQLAVQFHASADGVAVADRMLELLDGSPEAKPTRMLLAPSPLDAPVRLEAVSFAYPSRPGLVLDGLDLELRPGETVALVGPSGCGKTTVANLVLGFVEPNTGRVTVGGHDLALCRPDVWRGHIAWVPQQPTMFRGTIADNIRLGDGGACDIDVEHAALLAGLLLPLDTPVTENGRSLSSGQRQRVALARAFLRDAPVLLLDEPTAHLDELSAADIRDRVRMLMTGRTVIVVSHLHGWDGDADRVVRLDRGRMLSPVPA